ncbi:MAG: 2'-5' RNA ligase family protein [Clostridiales bacterium]|uniref:2'-5' RNA ligase family protein n=1 Tax=Clostridium sp. N3C TaxID=1776758 RepID=UPI00092E1A67|nr:2'-5' RNA ligase family protein [Clostridium sp. N3C]NLZ49339.1 2'-5' RNA ligase family protein [Clostridiales bacterium]SCN25354.1 2'-5' RNA ligase [Clostridium sp. N3C]
MKYYLVALFDNDSLKDIEKLQRSIAKKYKSNKNQSTLHITLDVIGETDIEKLDKIINKILKPYKRFKVEINNAICFEDPYRTVSLQVENKGYISRLARLINDTLKLHGISVRPSIEDWNLHVSLNSSNFPLRELSKNEYEAAYNKAKIINFYKLATIDRIELWKSMSNRKDMVVKSYPLREY